jgi:hypothetical protein
MKKRINRGIILNIEKGYKFQNRTESDRRTIGRPINIKTSKRNKINKESVSRNVSLVEGE